MQKEMTLREKAQKLYEYAFTIGWTDAMTKSRKHTKIIFRFGVRIPEIILSSGWNRTGKKTIKPPMPSRISL